jgi:polyisoprenoid-binding protein YceI
VSTPGSSRGRRRAGAASGAALVVATVLAASAGAAETYRVDPERSLLAVRLYRAGPAGPLAHDHVVEATEIAGRIAYDQARPEAASVAVEVRTASLRVDEPAARRRLGLEGDLSPGQRADVAESMRARDQLDVARFPTIRFRSTRVAPEGGRLRVTGELTIRGVTREVTFPATVTLDGAVLRGSATLSLLQSSFGYRPYSAFLGAVRNRDDIMLHVQLVATP